MEALQTIHLTTFQLKAARRALGFSYEDVSKETGIAVSALARLETSDLFTFPQHSNPTTVYKLRTFLEEQGIEFKSGNWVRLIPKEEQFSIRIKE